MAQGMNRVILLGHLGAEPELRHAGGGLAILKLRLATSETFYDRERQRQERTEWHEVTMFGNRAEALNNLMSKGDPILVEGGIRTSTYEVEGAKRYRTQIVARDIRLLAGRGGSWNKESPSPTGAPVAGTTTARAAAPTDGLDAIPF